MKTKLIKNKIFFLILLSVSLASTTEGIAGNGGSGYSRYGIGDLQYFLSSRAVGMGGSGIGTLSNLSIDRINPAGWTQINRTRFSIGYKYEGFSTTDGIKSGYYSGSSFNGIMIALPIVPSKGIVLSTGLLPYSLINYHVITPAASYNQVYNIEYSGDGGMSQAHIGISATIADNIHVGAKLNYYLGTLNYTTRQIFSQIDFADVTRSMELSGIGFSIGALYSGLNKMLGIANAKQISIGAVFSSKSNITSTEEKSYSFHLPTVTSRDTVVTYDIPMHLPLSFGVGLSYLTERYLFALDGYYQNWNNFTVGGNSFPEIRNSFRLSAGGELLPQRDQQTFFQRIPLRFGLFYSSSYYKLKGNPINEIGITGGFGIPIFSDTRIDIGAEYSIRGTTDQYLQKDKILRLTFTLSGGELWFVRPEQE